LGVICLTLVFGLYGCRSTQETNDIATRAVPQSSAQVETKVAVPTASFKAVIENVSLYPVPNNRQDLAVSLVVSMNNSGEPSTAKAWTLEIDSPDPTLPSGLTPVYVNGVVELPGTAGRKVDLGKEDLALKTSESSVGTNARVEGVLTFVLPKTTERELANNNTSFVLHFKDSAGNTYQTDKAVIGVKRAAAAQSFK
jgi:hypothetical protein